MATVDLGRGNVGAKETWGVGEGKWSITKIEFFSLKSIFPELEKVLFFPEVAARGLKKIPGDFSKESGRFWDRKWFCKMSVFFSQEEF